MTLLLFAIVSCALSLLTFFAGFGLGTLLMPVFALVLPVQVAVAATAIVHGANNIFKVALLWRQADPQVIVRFGVPALAASVVGAACLAFLPADVTWATWHLGTRVAVITPVKVVLGSLIVIFGLLELRPGFWQPDRPAEWLPVGGLLAGFFGGLSGHQGALRAAFLGRLGLAPPVFTATQAVLGLLVDAARLVVYAVTFLAAGTPGGPGVAREPIPWGLVSAAVAGALVGAFTGRSLLPKITVRSLSVGTGVLLVTIGLALALGVI